MEFLNRAVDTFLWHGGHESSELDSGVDIENLGVARRVPQSIGIDRRSQHGRPLEMIMYSSTADSIERADDLSTEFESSDSSFDEVKAGSIPCEPSVSRAPLRKATKSGNGATEKSREVSNFQCFHDDKYHAWIPHGRFWTIAGILFAWTGFACSYAARNTSRFVTVESPIYVDVNFGDVYDVGMVNIQLCLNETYTGMAGCSIHALDATAITDKMFQTARSMAFLAILLGGFLSASITIAVFWSTINLVPIGFGFLFSYFLQSLTFLLFDSDLCAVHKCHLSRGTTYSIVGSVCWILAGIASARMDAFKYRRTIAERLAAQRKNKGLKPSKFNRGISDVTQQTDITSEPTLPEHRNSSPQDGRGYQARFAKPHQGPSAGENNNRFQSSGDHEQPVRPLHALKQHL